MRPELVEDGREAHGDAGLLVPRETRNRRTREVGPRVDIHRRRAVLGIVVTRVTLTSSGLAFRRPGGAASGNYRGVLKLAGRGHEQAAVGTEREPSEEICEAFITIELHG